MHSSKITIKAGESVSLPADGSLVVFESGTSNTANNYIIIKGEAGSEIRLKQGQGMRAERSRTWIFRCEDPSATITANIIIGDGDFKDSAINAVIAGTVIVTSGAVQTVAGSVTQVNNPNENPVITTTQKKGSYQLSTVAVGTAATQVASNGSASEIRFRNANSTANIYLSPVSGMTVLNTAIVLAPGEMWIENLAPSIAWFGISDTPNASLIVNIV